MKKIMLVLIFILIATFSFGASVPLSWDLNQCKNNGYRVFQRTADSDYDYSSPIYDGKNSSFTVTNLDSKLYYFTIRAYNSYGFESGDSIEIEVDITEELCSTETPSAPTGCMIGTVTR